MRGDESTPPGAFAKTEPPDMPKTLGEEAFETRLQRAWPPEGWVDFGVVVAVSGGADSVALALGMARLKHAHQGNGSLVLAHFHHGLRGQEADRDAQFVAEWANRLQLPHEMGSAPVRDAAGEPHWSEAQSRQARYRFLADVAHRLGARYLATAHTANDQAETILHNILRGTGLAGLAGMERFKTLSEAVTLVRPLLEFQREEILEYLASREQPFCVDSTNRDRRYTRNRIRHELLPRLRNDFNPRVEEAILRLGAQARGAQQAIRSQVDPILENAMLRATDDEVELDCGALRELSEPLLSALLVRLWQRQNWSQQAMSYTRWTELSGLIRGRTAAHDLPGEVRARRVAERLHLVRKRDSRANDQPCK